MHLPCFFNPLWDVFLVCPLGTSKLVIHNFIRLGLSIRQCMLALFDQVSAAMLSATHHLAYWALALTSVALYKVISTTERGHTVAPSLATLATLTLIFLRLVVRDHWIFLRQCSKLSYYLALGSTAVSLGSIGDVICPVLDNSTSLSWLIHCCLSFQLLACVEACRLNVSASLREVRT